MASIDFTKTLPRGVVASVIGLAALFVSGTIPAADAALSGLSGQPILRPDALILHVHDEIADQRFVPKAVERISKLFVAPVHVVPRPIRSRLTAACSDRSTPRN